MPGIELLHHIHRIGLSAIGAEAEVVVGKGLPDLFHERFRRKKCTALFAFLKLRLPDFIFVGNLEKSGDAELVTQFRSALRARIDAGSTTDALVVRVIEDPVFPFIPGLQGAGRAGQFAGGATRAFAGIHPGPAKEEGGHQDHGLTAEDVNGANVIAQEGKAVHTAVRQEVSRHKGQCGEKNDQIISRE